MIPMLGTMLSILLPAAAVVGTKTADKGSSRTLENLQAAFNGESNAHNKYLALHDELTGLPSRRVGI